MSRMFSDFGSKTPKLIRGEPYRQYYTIGDHIGIYCSEAYRYWGSTKANVEFILLLPITTFMMRMNIISYQLYVQ